jgi:ATP-dependent Lhr-like helicase
MERSRKDGTSRVPVPVLSQPLREGTGEESEEDDVLVLAATDPANPYGAALPWPSREEGEARPQRAAGSRVILFRGALIAYLGRTGRQLLTFLPDSESQRSEAREALIKTLGSLAAPGSPVLLAKIDGREPAASELSSGLLSCGFSATSRGYLHRGIRTEEK